MIMRDRKTIRELGFIRIEMLLNVDLPFLYIESWS